MLINPTELAMPPSTLPISPGYPVEKPTEHYPLDIFDFASHLLANFPELFNDYASECPLFDFPRSCSFINNSTKFLDSEGPFPKNCNGPFSVCSSESWSSASLYDPSLDFPTYTDTTDTSDSDAPPPTITTLFITTLLVRPMLLNAILDPCNFSKIILPLLPPLKRHSIATYTTTAVWVLPLRLPGIVRDLGNSYVCWRWAMHWSKCASKFVRKAEYIAHFKTIILLLQLSSQTAISTLLHPPSNKFSCCHFPKLSNTTGVVYPTNERHTPEAQGSQ
ncbi:hypothetical protein HOY80DRAFT_997875 [Tuber brumale]|nr:hypothetical protein HOY80DRAFT_997875 [Tuber brumale]